MRKYLVFIIISCLLLVVDNTLTPYISIAGYYPSLLWAFVLCYAWVGDISDAISLGVISGILQDIYFYDVMGINTLTNIILCSLICYLGRNFIKEKILVPIVLIFLASILKGVTVFIVMKILGVNINNTVIIYRSIYDVFVAVFMFNAVNKLSKVEFMKKKWGFREN